MENDLYDYLDEKEIQFIETEIPVKSVKGLYFDNTIIIDENIATDAERRCVLAEEIGHYETSNGNILDQGQLEAVKQEQRARRWAHLRLLSLDQLVACFENGLRNRYECAEYLNVTEAFFDECIKSYTQIYGPYVAHKDYLIYFKPLGVMKMME